jgi:hypothetical protein
MAKHSDQATSGEKEGQFWLKQNGGIVDEDHLTEPHPRAKCSLLRAIVKTNSTSCTGDWGRCKTCDSHIFLHMHVSSKKRRATLMSGEAKCWVFGVVSHFVRTL